MSDEITHSASVDNERPSFGFKPDELQMFRGTPYELIPLHSPATLDVKGRELGKAPLKGWRTCPSLDVDDAKQRLAEGSNVGVRLREVDLVIDIDPRNFAPGDDPVKRLSDALEIHLDDWPHVATGAGGHHYYMTVPAGFRAVDTLDDYRGIEFKGHGRQVVSPGSSHPLTRMPYAWDDDPLGTPLTADVRSAPERLMKLIERPQQTAVTDAGEVSPDQLSEMLDGLEVEDFRDQDKWLNLMMACHHATAGDGRDEFISWSTYDPMYADRAYEIGQRWDSLHADAQGRRVTVKTLFKFLSDAGKSDLIPRDDPALDFPEDVEPEILARLEGVKSTKPNFSDGLAGKWVWVTRAEQFISRSDCQRFVPFQFKAHYQHMWSDGDILSAVWKGKLPLRKFEGCAYVPGGPEVIADGKWAGYYNTWRKGGVAARQNDDLANVFLEHMIYLLPDETERGYALDYLSFLVRDDFVKVHFALLLQGAPGTGKSYIGSVVERMIGMRNTRMVKSQELTKEYTSWQEDRQLAIVEEIMARGRIELVNELKTVITGDTLRIRRMRTDTYEVPNGLNLLCFTNHENAVPIEQGDRRWLTLFSPAEPREHSYYEKLFELAKGDEFAAAVKWMLQNRDVGLNPKGMAPSTQGKLEMRRRSIGDVEQYLTELLEEGAEAFKFDLTTLDDVWRVAKIDFKTTKNLRGRVGDWLKGIGAVQHTAYKKQDNSNRPGNRLWSLRNHDKWEEAGAAKRIDAWLEYHNGKSEA